MEIYITQQFDIKIKKLKNEKSVKTCVYKLQTSLMKKTKNNKNNSNKKHTLPYKLWMGRGLILKHPVFE